MCGMSTSFKPPYNALSVLSVEPDEICYISLLFLLVLSLSIPPGLLIRHGYFGWRAVLTALLSGG